MKQTISILGCGWLGLPLAERLVKEGFRVKGSTTTLNKIFTLSQKNIEPYLVILNPDLRTDDFQDFLKSEILIVNIPPKRGEYVIELFTSQMKYLLKEVSKSSVKKILFVSSTSVYDETNSEITELTELAPSKDSGKALVITENILKQHKKFDTTIIRFGGLIGPERHPGRFLGGRKRLDGGNAPVNLVHLEDCIEIILEIIDKNVWNETFNACADEHPTRKTLYTKAAQKLNIEPPEFTDEDTNYKIVVSKKIKEKLNYSFKYPNPLEMF